MDGRERTFALLVSAIHGMDHLVKQLFPPLVPIWGLAFGFPLWQLGLVMGARTFGTAVGQAPMGVLADRYDRRYLLPAGFAVMGVGVVLVGLVPAVPAGVLRLGGVDVGTRFATLLAAMLATGLGSSVVHPAGYPLISANVDASRKGTVLGAWGSASKFGDGAAPALVGALLLVAAWTEILALVGVVVAGFGGVLVIWLRDFETRPAGHLVPGPGASAADADDASADGEADATAGGTSADGASSDGGRWGVLVPLLAIAAYAVVVNVAVTGVKVFLPEFITTEYGYVATALGTTLTPASTASFYFAAVLLVAGLAQLGTGRLADRFDERRLLLAFLAAAAAVLAVLAVVPLSPVALLVVLAALGVALFGTNPPRDALVSRLAPADREGRVFGYLWTATYLAIAVTPPVVGLAGDVAGLRAAFLALVGVLALSAVPLLLVGGDRFAAGVGGRPGGVEAD